MIVTEEQIVAAMHRWESDHTQTHGPLDGLTLPKQCSKLAELLGTMWYHRETSAEIPDESDIANLILAAP